MTRGLPILSSYPSRRIVSIKIAKCRMPRPFTAYASAPSIISTRSATLRWSSLSSLALSCRVVTYLPSRPTIGDELTLKTISSVGSSTVNRGSGLFASTALIVSPISTPASPSIATMSPAVADSAATRPSFSKTNSPPTVCLVTPSRP